MISALFHFQHTLNRLFSNCIKSENSAWSSCQKINYTEEKDEKPISNTHDIIV